VKDFDLAGLEIGGCELGQDRIEQLLGSGGALAGWRITTSSDQTEIYDAEGKLTSIANRAGLTQSFTYSDAGTPPSIAPRPGLLIRVADAFGRELHFVYDASARISTMTAPGGGVYTYRYDEGLTGRPAGHLTSVTYPDATTRSYQYELDRAAGRDYFLTGITDEHQSRFATYTYDPQGRGIQTEHAIGAEREHITYPSIDEAEIRTYVDATRSALRRYRFMVTNGVWRHSSIEVDPCPECGPQARTFDPASGIKTSETDWNGSQTCFAHDARGLETARGEGLAACPADLASWTPAAGTVERKITTEWHPVFRLPTKLTEPKREITLAYDPVKGTLLTRSVRDLVTSSTRSWTYTYNANGQVVTVDGPRTDLADVTTTTYYPNDDPDLGKRGNVATIANALGHVTQISAYNAHGQPLAIVDPNGLTTTLAYDARQRLTSRNLGGEVTSYEYDGVGQLTKVTLSDGSFLSYTYDPAHRLTGIADSLGNRIAYTLDLMGNRTKEEVFDPSNALAQTRSRVYSSLNRLTQEIGAQSQSTSYAYDNQGNVTGITDPLNRVTANAYDALNRLKQMTDPAAGVTRYGYDGLDQLASVTDPRNNATTYTVDGLGNLTAQLSPDTGSTTNAQDAAGNVVSSTDAKGQTTTSSFDALNRLTRIVYNQATGSQLKQIDYAYDQGAFGIGRLTTLTETSAAGSVLQSTAYSFDQKGRVTSEARTIGGVIATTSYAYDAAGRMTGMTYPSGRATSYQFDALGRVSRIETTGGGTSQVVLQDVAYQPFEPVKAFTFGNLQPYARTFDLDGRIASHSLANQTKVLAFDPASRITRIEQQGTPTNFADYGYDVLDRLTSTILPASTFGFSYDPVGNRLSKSTPSGTDTYAISPTSNRLASITGATTKTYAHDANGSITSDGLVGFTYDPRGRLVSSTSAIGTTTYQVNALGQRVRKTSSLGDVLFHYDSQGRLIAESSPGGAPIREYLWLGDQPVAVAAYTAGGGCPATPTLDTSNTFVAFDAAERLEARGGTGGSGGGGWEWQFAAAGGPTANGQFAWVSGKTYGLTLSYGGAGSASVVVRDGATTVLTLSVPSGMDAGNALKLTVRANPNLGVGAKIRLALSQIDGTPSAQVLETPGDNQAAELALVYAGESLRDGFAVEGTVTMTFSGSAPPQGGRLRLSAHAGNVTCVGGGGSPTATLHYVLADHLNTPRVVTNQAQQVVWRWENQEPFGNSPPEENPSGLGSFEFPLRFPGQVFDRETGTLYNWHRDLDPATGRYVQSDPMGIEGGINPYLYAYASPLLFIDPDGLQAGPHGAPSKHIPGGPWNWSPDPNNSRGGTFTDPKGQSASWDAKGNHWDVDDGKGGRQRYNRWGKPITPKQAHSYKGPRQFPLWPKALVCPPLLDQLALSLARHACLAGDLAACSTFRMLGGQVDIIGIPDI
jgi:RHS repeat-associated protein